MSQDSIQYAKRLFTIQYKGIPVLKPTRIKRYLTSRLTPRLLHVNQLTQGMEGGGDQLPKQD